ncbi:uncharacterized protein blow [Ochlerotatus camptorhynchus]|uniref:uncharacterized protein blow n=1 Tax=Ochlerotatus camptorhynchus TaxID=644619 RepID=UPI0031E290EA
MDIKTNLVEWMELLNDMLQFLDATAVAEMRSQKAINGTQRRHPQCADLKCEQKCDWCLQAGGEPWMATPGTDEGDGERGGNDRQESAEYMNIVNKIDESRYTLIHKCNAVLRKLHEWMSSASTSLLTKKELEEEEENSYLDMGGVGHKNDINLTQPSDKIDSCEKFESNDADILVEVEPSGDNGKNEEELNMEENCYDFTTDRCLYDDYSSDIKLNNVACVIPVDEDDSKCPFSGLPAAHLRIKQSPKYGTLFRHEKRLFFDQTKKFYVGLLDRWLLLYNNSNELKPAHCIHVKDIKLDLNLNDQINEKNQFHIITQSDMKICFLSPSFMELNEWIVALEQNLLTKTESIPPNNSPRKLPLPPTPDEQPDNSCLTRNDHVDSIYEEPQLLHKQRELVEELQNDYDTPKPASVDVCHQNQSQQHTKTSPTKIINDALISPTRANKYEPIRNTVGPTVATNVSASPTTPTTTPVKSWLFNRFHKSPSSSDGGEQQKHTRKVSAKKLSFPQQEPWPGTRLPQAPHHLPDVIGKPPNATKTSSSTVPSASGKGTKINMIISQLEANGQLSLLSKSLNGPTKRNTWCVEE